MSRKRSARRRSRRYRARFVEGALEQRRRRGDARTASTTSSSRFSGFGFPKSHAAAFALLAYQSAWLRHYYPAEFLCALLNAQPMGFYPPATLVRDAPAARGGGAPARRQRQRRRARAIGGRRRRACWGSPVRALGRRGGRADARRRARAGRPVHGVPTSPAHAAPRSGRSSRSSPAAPATASARRGARCSGSSASCRVGASVPGSGGEERQLALPLEPTAETPELPEQTVVGADARRLPRHAPLGRLHPLSCSARTSRRACSSAAATCPEPPQRRARSTVAGMVVARQRPSTANGVVFMLLEDEHGHINLIVPPPVYERLPRRRPRRAAHPRPRPLRARRPQPQHRRLAARDARPARAARLRGGRRRRSRLPGAHFRPSLSPSSS